MDECTLGGKDVNPCDGPANRLCTNMTGSSGFPGVDCTSQRTAFQCADTGKGTAFRCHDPNK